MIIFIAFASAEVDESISPPPASSSCTFCSIPKDLGTSELSSGSKLWVLDRTCNSRKLETSLPAGTSSHMEIVTGEKGYMMLFHRLPSGDLQTRYLGHLYPGRRYSLSFCSVNVGTHELWYRIGWQESNRVRFHVWV